MTTAEMAFIGLAGFGIFMLVLAVLGAIARLLLGPDQDLEQPWDPTR